MNYIFFKKYTLWVLRFLKLQLFISLFAMPILLWWGLPLSILSPIGNLIFGTGLSSAATLSTGKIGIGISSPSYQLDVLGSGSGTLTLHRIQNNVTAANNSASQMLFSANRTTSGMTDVAGISGMITDITQAAYKGALLFSTANNASPAERMRIDNNGNIGIGTSPSSNSRLHVKNGHLRSEQTTAPTVAVTTQNGITAAAIAAGSGDTKGNITTTGTNNGTNTVLTITFNMTYSVAPIVVITAANANAQACTYYVTSTTTTFVLNFKGGGATPSFNYTVIE